MRSVFIRCALSLALLTNSAQAVLADELTGSATTTANLAADLGSEPAPVATNETAAAKPVTATNATADQKPDAAKIAPEINPGQVPIPTKETVEPKPVTTTNATADQKPDAAKIAPAINPGQVPIPSKETAEPKPVTATNATVDPIPASSNQSNNTALEQKPEVVVEQKPDLAKIIADTLETAVKPSSANEILTLIAVKQHPFLSLANFSNRQEDLYELYKPRNFQSLWLGNADSDKHITEALKLLESAAEYGLNPASYDTSILQEKKSGRVSLSRDCLY